MTSPTTQQKRGYMKHVTKQDSLLPVPAQSAYQNKSPFVKIKVISMFQQGAVIYQKNKKITAEHQ